MDKNEWEKYKDDDFSRLIRFRDHLSHLRRFKSQVQNRLDEKMRENHRLYLNYLESQ